MSEQEITDSVMRAATTWPTNRNMGGKVKPPKFTPFIGKMIIHQALTRCQCGCGEDV